MNKLLVILLLMLAGVVIAQEPQLEQDSDQETASEPAIDPEAADSELVLDENAELEEESPERFIPTEEISQDFGVSFPVDI